MDFDKTHLNILSIIKTFCSSLPDQLSRLCPPHFYLPILTFLDWIYIVWTFYSYGHFTLWTFSDSSNLYGHFITMDNLPYGFLHIDHIFVSKTLNFLKLQLLRMLNTEIAHQRKMIRTYLRWYKFFNTIYLFYLLHKFVSQWYLYRRLYNLFCTDLMECSEVLRPSTLMNELQLTQYLPCHRHHCLSVPNLPQYRCLGGFGTLGPNLNMQGELFDKGPH